MLSPTSELRAWFELVLTGLQIVGLLIGALWLFYVFVLGRSYAPNILTHVALKQIITLGEYQTVILLEFAAKNEGKTAVNKKSCDLRLVQVETITRNGKLPEIKFQRLDPPLNKIMFDCPTSILVFNEHKSWEPGEQATDEVLIDIGAIRTFKISVTFLESDPSRLWFRDQGRSWTTNVLFSLDGETLPLLQKEQIDAQSTTIKV